MIRELTRIIVEENEDGTQTTRLPNNAEMMNKINEIIAVVNILDAKSITMARQLDNQKFKEMLKPKTSSLRSGY